MIKKYFALSLITASVLAMGCSSDDDKAVVTPADPTETVGVGNSVMDKMRADANADYSDLIGLIELASLNDLLDNEAKSFTLFAPNNAALATVDATALADLKADTTKLADALKYHVIVGQAIDASGAITTAGLASPGNEVAMADGNKLTLTIDAATNDLLANGTVVTGDVDTTATNSVIHVVAGLLTPPATGTTGGETDTTSGTTDTTSGTTTSGTGGGAIVQSIRDLGTFTKFLAAAEANPGYSKIDSTVDPNNDPWTIFAPTDTALGTGDYMYLDHVAVGAQTIPEMIAATTWVSASGTSYTVAEVQGGGATVGGFKIEILGNPGPDGSVTYSIDGVLQ